MIRKYYTIIKMELIFRIIFNFYFFLYWLCLKNLSPKGVYYIQKLINKFLNILTLFEKDLKILLKKIHKSKNKKLKQYYFDFVNDIEMLKDWYFLIVDDMIIKYIFHDECGPYMQLSINHNHNTNYNFTEVKKNLSIIKEYITKNVYYIVTDLSYFNLDCGDYIFNEGEFFNYKDIKQFSFSKSFEILNSTLNNKEIILKSKVEQDEYIRLKKQIEKHKIIDQSINYPIFGKEDIRFQRCFYMYKGFFSDIQKDMKAIKSKAYIKREVDECISYLIINNSKIKNYDANEYMKIINKYIPNGYDCFSYKEFMMDPTIARPYFFSWKLKDYRLLITESVQILFKINTEQLLEMLKDRGLEIVFSKIKNEDRGKHLIYNNKSVSVRIEDAGIVTLGSMNIYCIPAMFYTANDVINYITDILLQMSK